jgi:multidrug efflux system membrane fusion protein
VQTSDQSGLAVITQRQPIAVVFTIPQDQLSRVLLQLNGKRRLDVDAYDRNLETKLASGTLSAVDSQIDPATGTIKLKGTFPNQNEALYPNQFVNARLLVQTIRHAILVPAAAVQRGPQNTFVYVVNSGGTVESRDVIVSMTENDESVIARGLSPGEVVVTDGVDRLQPGARVAVRAAGTQGQKGSR